MRRPVPLHAVLELTGILSLVVVAEGFGDEPVVVDRPLLETADPHGVSRAPRSGIRSGEGPMELDAVAVHYEVVHEDLHVRQGDVKATGSFGDRRATDGWRPVIDRQ